MNSKIDIQITIKVDSSLEHLVRSELEEHKFVCPTLVDT